jgi:hypothetical protein
MAATLPSIVRQLNTVKRAVGGPPAQEIAEKAGAVFLAVDKLAEDPQALAGMTQTERRDAQA